jgi:hypothetical protein
MTEDTLTMHDRETAEDIDGMGVSYAEAPSYVLDEIDEVLAADEDDDFELDLTADAPLTTETTSSSTSPPMRR